MALSVKVKKSLGCKSSDQTNVAHTFNLSTQQAEAGDRPAWSTESTRTVRATQKPA